MMKFCSSLCLVGVWLIIFFYMDIREIIIFLFGWKELFYGRLMFVQVVGLFVVYNCVMEIFKIFMFEVVYCFFNVLLGYKCVCLYGYLFWVELKVEGEFGVQIGWIMDFGDVKVVFQLIYDCLDYYYFNDIFGLENLISENLVVWIWNEFKFSLLVLSEIIVYEICIFGCCYRGLMF